MFTTRVKAFHPHHPPLQPSSKTKTWANLHFGLHHDLLKAVKCKTIRPSVSQAFNPFCHPSISRRVVFGSLCRGLSSSVRCSWMSSVRDTLCVSPLQFSLIFFPPTLGYPKKTACFLFGFFWKGFFGPSHGTKALTTLHTEGNSNRAPARSDTSKPETAFGFEIASNVSFFGGQGEFLFFFNILRNPQTTKKSRKKNILMCCVYYWDMFMRKEYKRLQEC